MKKILIITALVVMLASCGENEAKGPVANNTTAATQTATVDESKLTTIQWIDSIQQDLGTVKEGQTPEISWRFRNTGDQPLVIQNVSATCGCTVAEKPEQPVLPGEEGVIKAKFNSNGRVGPNKKEVVVVANTKEQQQLVGFTIVVEGK